MRAGLNRILCLTALCVSFTVTTTASLLTEAAVHSSFDQSFPGCQNVGTDFASASCSGPGFSASSFASAGYGTMKIFAQSSGSTSFQTDAFLEVVDGFTILNASAGDSFQMAFTLSGEVTLSASAPSNASIAINAGINRGGGCVATFPNTVSASTPYTCIMDKLLDGSSFFSSIELSAGVELRRPGSGTVDFSHSLDITQVAVLLANGNVDPNAIIQTSSGFVYPNGSPSSAPETSTLVTTITAMGALFLFRRGTHKFFLK